MEFLRAAPAAAVVLEAEERGAWGEMGRRLAMGDAERQTAFSLPGRAFNGVPRRAAPADFQICTRQMTFPSSVALETF